MLINLEGCDSAGKSTQVKLIIDYYEKLGKTVKYIHFPMYGHNMFSEMITDFLKGKYGENDKVDPYFVSEIYTMDRYMYKEQLLKDLKEYDVVLIDRYVFSNVAYQVPKVKDDYFMTPSDLLNHIIEKEFIFLKLPYPNLILFLDVPIFEIEKRLNDDRIGEDREYLDGEKDIHEQDIKYQENVRQIYLSISGLENVKIVETYKDKLLTPKEIFNSYKKYLEIK